MTITAQSVVRRVVNTLNDASSVRWTLNEIVRALNDGQMVILEYRSDLMSATATFSLVAGTRQSVQPQGAKLLKVVRNNNGTTKSAVRLALMEHLDALNPDWHDDPQSDIIAHYMVDGREEANFWVYPPATTSAKVDAMFVQFPTLIAEPGISTSLPADSSTDASAPTVVLGNVTVRDDIAVGALVDYVIYRMLAKNAGFAGDLQRATAHFQAFTTALGIDAKGDLSGGPTNNSPFNPSFPETPHGD